MRYLTSEATCTVYVNGVAYEGIVKEFNYDSAGGGHRCTLTARRGAWRCPRLAPPGRKTCDHHRILRRPVWRKHLANKRGKWRTAIQEAAVQFAHRIMREYLADVGYP